MKKTTYVLGLFTGGIILGSTVLLSTPVSGKKLRYELSACRDAIVENWVFIKQDLLELISLGVDLKEEGINLIRKKLPEINEKIDIFKEEIKPFLEEFKNLAIELELLIERLKEVVSTRVF
ncbi:YtxH domain-containing protein [Evansella sp. AB-rgal1]|uniref:YtxH domain-containing protein n=1 Tax=Evansella sp. AB-rgal1 TaxID=3242696 RepID=UPI00359D3261